MRKLVMLISVLCLLLPLMADYDWELNERWVIEPGEEDWTSEDNNELRGVAGNPKTGNILVAVGDPAEVHIFEGRHGGHIGTLAEPEEGFDGTRGVANIDVLPTGQIVVANLAVAGDDPYIYFYSDEDCEDPEVWTMEDAEGIRTGDALTTRQDSFGNTEILMSGGFGSEGMYFLVRRTAAGNWTDPADVEIRQVEDEVENLSSGFLPDGNFALGHLGGFNIYERQSGDIIEEAPFSQSGTLMSNVYFDIEGYQYVGLTGQDPGTDYPNVSIYNAQTGVRVATAEIDDYLVNTNTNGTGGASVYPYAYIEDGFVKLYVAAGATNNFVGVWEIQAPVDVDSWEQY